MAEILIVQSKVKDYIKSKGCNTSGNAADALSKAVTELLNKAIARCKANGRKTVSDKDI